MIGNAQVTYNEERDILSVRNLYARGKCVETKNGLHNIVKRYDIQEKACAFDIEEATYLFRNDIDFLRDFSFIDLQRQQRQRWT